MLICTWPHCCAAGPRECGRQKPQARLRGTPGGTSRAGARYLVEGRVQGHVGNLGPKRFARGAPQPLPASELTSAQLFPCRDAPFHRVVRGRPMCAAQHPSRFLGPTSSSPRSLGRAAQSPLTPHARRTLTPSVCVARVQLRLPLLRSLPRSRRSRQFSQRCRSSTTSL